MWHCYSPLARLTVSLYLASQGLALIVPGVQDEAVDLSKYRLGDGLSQFILQAVSRHGILLLNL
jgi:hypothetical protein